MKTKTAFRMKAIAAATVLGLAMNAEAATLTVTNALDSGAGSLREALTTIQADSVCSGAPYVVTFNIPTPATGEIEILVGSLTAGFPLPNFNCETTIDGYSQPGAVRPSSIPVGLGPSGAALRIFLNGVNVGASPGPQTGIRLGGTNSVVQGIAVGNFADTGISLEGSSVAAYGNFVGLRADGITPAPNGRGVAGLGFNAIVGGPLHDQRNVIGANTGRGIDAYYLWTVKNNLVGTAADGVTARGNGVGVWPGIEGITVGGAALGDANRIAHNAKGISTNGFANSGFFYVANEIYANSLIGIDVGDDGPTPNDPTDSDNRQNFPVINDVTFSGGNTNVNFTLNTSVGATPLTIEFFGNDDALGQGKFPIPACTLSGLTADTSGIVGPLTAVCPGIHPNVTTTATRNAFFGGTSEFSAPFLTPDMTPSTTTVNFPATALGNVSAIVPLSIQNSGLGDLTIDSITNPGFAEFFDTTGGAPPSSAHYCGVGSDSTGAPLSGSSISIASGASCVLNLAFNPQASGSRSATLTFNDTGSPNSTVVVTLAGTGGTLIPLPTTVSFSPTNLTLPGPVPPASTLGINVDNPNGAPAQGLSFTQALPANLVIAPTPNAGVLGASCSGSILSALPGASSFTVDSLFVPTNGACDVLVDVTSSTAGSYPVSVAAGAITGTILSQAVSNALSNTGTLAVDAASLQFTPPSPVDFGAVSLGSSAPIAVNLMNTGSAPLNFSAPFTVTGPNAADFTFTDTCVPDPNPQIAPGGSCTVNITFAPSALGPLAASMSFPSNTLTSPDVLSLTGTGSATPVPVVSLSTTSMLFPAQTVGTTSSPQTATLSNIGTAPLNISSIASTGDFAQSSDCGTTLAQSASCTISVTFTPLITGLRTGDVKVFDDASGSPHAIFLDGDGVAPAVPTVTAPSSVSFPTTQVGGTSSAIDVTIGNSGGAALAISAVEIVGTGFSKVSDGCSGASVSASGSCVVSIVFAPTASGAISATLRILSNAPTSPNFVGLSGQATVAPIASLSATPAALVFGEQVVNTTSPAQTVTLANTGGATATVSGVTVTGDYAQTNNCATVIAGESCTISVTFTPTGTGSRPGSLVVAGDASNAPLTIALSGSAAPPALPVIELSVSSLSYGNTLTGTGSGTQSVTLRNIGGSPLTIASLRRTGEFTVSSGCPSVVPAGESCRIDVAFLPTVPGPRTGRLDVLSDASNGTKGVDLGGTGCRFSFLNRNYTLLCQ